MEPWMVQIIISLVGVIVTLGAVIGIMKNALKSNNPNGAKKLNGEFSAQVQTCNERFIQIAEDKGEVSASLKSIDARLEHIEKRLPK